MLRWILALVLAWQPASCQLSSYVAAGRVHSCVVATNTSLYCWGMNDFGQLGVGDQLTRPVPAKAYIAGNGADDDDDGSSNSGFTQTSAGGWHSCALRTPGVLFCWGMQSDGRVGNGYTTPGYVPTLSFVNTGGVTNQVSAGTYHTCARGSYGVKCWGWGGDGQLGDGGTASSGSPVSVAGMPTGGGLAKRAASIAAGDRHSCAAMNNGSAYCWGKNLNGQIGDGTSGNYRIVPVQVVASAGTIVTKVAAGTLHTCGIFDGTAMCWGDGDSGQLGAGDYANRYSPSAVTVLPAAQVADIDAGDAHSCAVLNNGIMYCWGANSGGRLGDGTLDPRPAPVLVQGLPLKTIATISCGLSHTCASMTDGTVYCWGYGRGCRLGIGSEHSSSLPLQLRGLDDLPTVDVSTQATAQSGYVLTGSVQVIILELQTSKLLTKSGIEWQSIPGCNNAVWLSSSSQAASLHIIQCEVDTWSAMSQFDVSSALFPGYRLGTVSQAALPTLSYFELQKLTVSDAGAMTLDISYSYFAPPATPSPHLSVSIAPLDGGALVPCTMAAPDLHAQLLQCTTRTGMSAGTVMIQSYNIQYNLSDPVYPPLAPQILSVSPGIAVSAASASSTRMVNFTITARGFRPWESALPVVQVASLPCLGVYYVSASTISCHVRATLLHPRISMSHDVSVTLPNPPGMSAGSISRSYTLPAVVSVQADTSPPKGTLPSVQIPLLSSLHLDLLSSLYDDQCAAGDLLIQTTRIIANPPAVAPTFTIPSLRQQMPLSQYEVSTANASIVGTVQVTVQVSDDSNNAVTRTLSIVVVNVVAGSIAPTMNASAVEPHHTNADMLCATATFVSDVSGWNVSKIMASAWQSGTGASIPGWTPSISRVALDSSRSSICVDVTVLPSGSLVELSLPAGTAHDAADASVASQALDITFIRDTIGPVFQGAVCQTSRAGDVSHVGRGIWFYCSLPHTSVYDDVDTAPDISIQAISPAHAMPGEHIMWMNDTGPTFVSVGNMPRIHGLLLRGGLVDLEVALVDRAGNVAVSTVPVFVWEPSVWQPRIVQVRPALMPTAGGDLTLIGTNFTALSPIISAVHIGHVACAVQSVSMTEIMCVLAAGLGGHLTARVEFPGNITAQLPDAVSFLEPRITTVEALPGSTFSLIGPSGVSVGASDEAAHQRVTLVCSECGLSASDIENVTVGGVACVNLSQTRLAAPLSCVVPAEQHGHIKLFGPTGSIATAYGTAVTTEVVVCAAGQCSARSTLDVVGAAQVLSLRARETIDGHHLVTTGDEIALTGWALGRVADDILRVMVGPVECTDYFWVSSTGMTLVIPAPSAASTQQLLPVYVVTKSGWVTPSSTALTVSYRGAYNAARAPRVAPALLGVSRSPSAMAAWSVSFDLAHDAALEQVPAEAVWLSWRTHASAAWSEPVSFDIKQFTSWLSMVGTSWSATVNDVRCPGYAVQVRASVVNAGGSGPWSSTPASVPAAVPARALVRLSASRAVGVPSTVSVAMDVMMSAELRAFPPTHIRLWAATVGTLQQQQQQFDKLANESTAVSSLVHFGSAFSLAVADLTSKSLNGSQAMQYHAELPSMSRSPLLFTATVVSAAGSLAPTAVSSVVYDVCQVDQYLRTELLSTDMDAVKCGACPTGAWCGAGSFDTLMPVEGWCRLSWTPYALTTQRCTVVDACPGMPAAVAARVADNRTASAYATAEYAAKLASYSVVGSSAMGRASREARCTTGYSGTSCRGCATHYSQSTIDGTCRPCKSLALHIFLLIVGFIVISAGLAYLIITTIRSGADEASELSNGLKKLLFSHNQQVSLAVGFQFAWPASISWLLNSMDFLSNVSDSVMATDCLVSTGGLSAFRLRIIGVLVSPWMLLSAIAGMWVAAHYMAKSDQCSGICCANTTTRRGFEQHPRSLSTSERVARMHDATARADRAASHVRARGIGGGVSGVSAASPVVSVDMRGEGLSRRSLMQWRFVRQCITVSGIVVCFVLHTSVTKAALRQFSCITLPNDPTHTQVLADDYDVLCTSPENVGWILGLGMPGFVLYGLGMPALLWWLMWKQRRLLQTNELKQRLGFLYVSYRPHAWYFEPVIMLRKALLAIISVNMAPAGLALQTYAAILLLFAALLLHVNLRPMANARLQRLEQYSLVISVLTLLGGLFLTANASEGMAILVSLVIVGANLIFIVAIAGQLLWELVDAKRVAGITGRIVKAQHVIRGRMPSAMRRRWTGGGKQAIVVAEAGPEHGGELELVSVSTPIQSTGRPSNMSGMNPLFRGQSMQQES